MILNCLFAVFLSFVLQLEEVLTMTRTTAPIETKTEDKTKNDQRKIDKYVTASKPASQASKRPTDRKLAKQSSHHSIFFREGLLPFNIFTDCLTHPLPHQKGTLMPIHQWWISVARGHHS